jgi:pimeloyl-ACP methyl ester carboxylesterase
MRKLLQSFSYAVLVTIGLIVLLLLFSSLMIATDLTKQELIDEYANEKSFFYFLPSGAEVHIRDEGNKDKPPLILLHGANGSLHNWEKLVSELENDYRLISFDLPGHGLTGATPQEDYSNIAMANFTREVIGLYDFDTVTLVGHSAGGGAALRYALMYPREVDAMVLVSSSGMQRDEGDSPGGAYALTRSSIGLSLLRYFTPKFMLASTLKGQVGDPDNFVTDKMVTRYWKLLRMAGSRDAAIKRYSERHLEPPLEPILRAVNPTTLLLWGSQDTVIDPKYGIEMNTQIVGSLLKLYPQAGHLAHEEMPEKAAADIRQFLARALYTQ